MVASSWPGTSYFLKRKDVPALVQSPFVSDIAKAVGKKPPQVSLHPGRNLAELTEHSSHRCAQSHAADCTKPASLSRS